jgi:exonuclease SbcD
MRILHTSDWHLGRSFGPVSLSGDQERFCDLVLDIVADQSIDLVVIAGDIYDRAIAPVDAIELFRDTVRRLRSAGVVVAAISGNHDGADRVSPYDDLLDASGVIIRGGYEGVGRVVRHEFADGPLDLALLPFLDPQAAPDGFGVGGVGGADERDGDGDALARRRRHTHQSVLAAAVDRTRSALTAPRSLAIAHAFVTGGTVSDSERALEVGGTGEVPAAIFDGFSYTALGHLHRPQDITRPTLRYSGTPMPYSFSEDHAKSVTVVDMDATGACAIDTIEVTVGRGVRTITGTIDELLDPGRHPDAHGRFVRAFVTDRETVLDAKARLEEVYPHVVEVRLDPAGARQGATTGPTAEIHELRPIDAVTGFWAEIEGSEPDGELLDILSAAVTSADRSPS